MAELKTAKPVKGGLTMATDKLVDFDHVTDYISREAAIYVHKLQCAGCANQQDQDYSEHCKVCTIYNEIKCTEALPAADVRPVVRARWEDETGYIFSNLAQRVYCPACKSYAYFYPGKTKNFCPTCGADMRGPNLDTTKGERRDESSG